MSAAPQTGFLSGSDTEEEDIDEGYYSHSGDSYSSDDDRKKPAADGTTPAAAHPNRQPVTATTSIAKPLPTKKAPK